MELKILLPIILPICQTSTYGKCFWR